MLPGPLFRGRAALQGRERCCESVGVLATVTIARKRLLSLGIPAGCLLLLLVIGPARFTTHAGNAKDGSILLYTIARNYDSLAWMHGADRFSPYAAVFVHDQKGQHRLVPTFVASADAAVSFDGQRALFAGKPLASDPWQIWEIALAGGDPRRVTSGSEDCIRPFYLPDDRVVYARKISGRFVIEVVDLAGGKPLALTYSAASTLPTDVLHDGRILFEAGYPLGTESVPEIYTVYSDGSGVESYRCDHGRARHSGRQTGSGDIVFASAKGLSRFTSARAQEIKISAPAGEYAGDLAETADGDWLLSWRRDAKDTFQLMRWTPGASELQPIQAQPGVNLVQPVLLAPRAIPNRHPSGLHDWPNANLLCLNAYTSKYAFAPGSIRNIKLYTRDPAGKTMLLGTAPAERDGSFFVQVPTEQPLQIELLDAAGKTLKREAGFFWMRRGEQRGCVGCHAGPETAPENAVPMILLKSTIPADMTGASAQNASGGH
jgi:Hydrazine synthase alpha subunit middle domain